VAIPNLLHPVPITIQQQDAPNTKVDDIFREPVQQSARKAKVVLQGQVKWGQDESLVPGKGGPKEDSDGYVLFRYVDQSTVGVTLKRGDRFTKLGKIDVDVYIVSIEPMGHWQDQGGATLFRAYFKDRQPGKQNRGTL